MKNSVDIVIGKADKPIKKYELCFNIKSLARMERAIGKSITSLFAAGPRGLVQQLDINVTTAALQNGIVDDKGIDIEQAYDIIQEFCDNGGTLDRLNAKIITAINETGLFIPGVKETPPEVVYESKK
ncbi:hypothetical protein [Pectinatus haikarae]|uniref:Phage protein n=1 Tax=Pectinatus haikarae TaxID=349096 RepID=A0ABT9Y8A2_9FIRM|nr:hypothetical protein [Pectinatus haikarae]MDQ0204068.1 hypothetical protein [Pectinatus haikarae]